MPLISRLIVLLLCFLTAPVLANDPVPTPPRVVQTGIDLQFTAAEQAWLAQKHVVRAHVIDYPPYHAFVDGRAQGMAIDYLEIAAQRAGFKIEYIDNKSWAKALADIRVPRNVDLLPAAYNTPERREYLAFTENILVTYSVIFVRDDSPFVNALADFAGKTIAVERDYGTHRWLEKDYPALKLRVVETTDEALQAVAGGQADAYVGSLTVATYMVKTRGLTNLKIAAPSPFGKDEQAIAVRRDWPELATIIDKALATMTAEEHAEISDRWLPPIQYSSGFTSREVFHWITGVSSVLLAVIVVILVWNKKLGREIAARAVVEDQLRQSEEKYRTLFERSTDAILIIEGDRFIDCNEATLKMLGYATRGAFLGSQPGELSPPIQPDGRESGEKAAEIMAIALEEGSHRFEWLHTRANGEVFPVEVQLTAISTGEQPVLHVVWRDISVRKQADEALLQLSEDLTRKNIELERFTYTVSHDLKSPLITIQGFAGVLAQSLGERIDEDIQTSLNFIDSAARKMYALLDDLLELSRIGRVVNPNESVSLGEIAREALELIEGRLANTPVTIGIADDLPQVTGDRVRLREVLQNLLENAVKYMGDQPEPQIEVGVAEVDGELACFVRDNGMGIPQRYQEKVFGLFERLSADGEGTGVGLTLVKRIVELHGGRIWIESAGLGQGTTFWFRLPWEAVPQLPAAS